jgi:hypothetical protein
VTPVVSVAGMDVQVARASDNEQQQQTAGQRRAASTTRVGRRRQGQGKVQVKEAERRGKERRSDARHERRWKPVGLRSGVVSFQDGSGLKSRGASEAWTRPIHGHATTARPSSQFAAVRHAHTSASMLRRGHLSAHAQSRWVSLRTTRWICFYASWTGTAGSISLHAKSHRRFHSAAYMQVLVCQGMGSFAGREAELGAARGELVNTPYSSCMYGVPSGVVSKRILVLLVLFCMMLSATSWAPATVEWTDQIDRMPRKQADGVLPCLAHLQHELSSKNDVCS